MSASITTAPARASFGRFSLAIALMALAVVIAAAVALVALNGTKTAAPTTGTATQYGQSVTNVPFYDHGWSSASTAAGQSVTNVPFYDHGWSIAGTSTTPAYFGPYYYNGYDSYAPFDATKGATTATGYPPFGATYAPPPASATRCPAPPTSPFASRRSTRAHVAIARIEPQYVAPRPRNQ